MNKDFWKRLWAYALARFGEPSTWVGIVGCATALGVKIKPEAWDAITNIGLFIVTGLLFALREGRNKPDNPSLPTTIKGEMPPAKAAIVPPSTEGMQALSKATPQAVDAAGEVHAQPPVIP